MDKELDKKLNDTMVELLLKGDAYNFKELALKEDRAKRKEETESIDKVYVSYESAIENKSASELLAKAEKFWNGELLEEDENIEKSIETRSIEEDFLYFANNNFVDWD